MRWDELKEGDLLIPKTSTGFAFVILRVEEHYVHWLNLGCTMRGTTDTSKFVTSNHSSPTTRPPVTDCYEVVRGCEVFK